MKRETKNKDWWKQFHWQDNPHSEGEAAANRSFNDDAEICVLGECDE
jgi:hypothetical protein